MIEFLKTCFSINLNEYENIGIDFEINKFLVLVFAAFTIGIVLYNSYRMSIKLALSQMIRHGARTEETARTLKELRLDNVRSVRRMLLKSNLLTKLTVRVDEMKGGDKEMNYVSIDTETKRNLDTARFYINEEKYSLAEGISSRQDISILNTVIACIFSCIICICVISCMPVILEFIDYLL